VIKIVPNDNDGLEQYNLQPGRYEFSGNKTIVVNGRQIYLSGRHWIVVTENDVQYERGPEDK